MTEESKPPSKSVDLVTGMVGGAGGLVIAGLVGPLAGVAGGQLLTAALKKVVEDMSA